MPHLKNKTVNALNLHTFFLHMVDIIGAIFGPVYALEKGMPLQTVLLYIALFFALRLAIRPTIVPSLVKKFGLIKCLMLASSLSVCSVLLVAISDGLDWWHLSYIIVFSTAGSSYWTCFHAYYSHSGQNESRGRHLSLTISLRTLSNAIITLLGGYITYHLGFSWYFSLAIPLGICAVLALKKCQTFSPEWVSWKDKGKIPLVSKANIIAAFYSLFTHSISFIWTFIVFLNTETVIEFAWVLVFGVIVKSFILAMQGHLFDKGHSATIHYTLIAAGTVLLTCMINIPLTMTSILIFEAARSTLDSMMNSTYGPISYNDSKRCKAIYWYWQNHEITWDVFAIMQFIISALLVSYGIISINQVLYTGFIGLAGLLLFLPVKTPITETPSPVA